jgi:hypothetical protein
MNNNKNEKIINIEDYDGFGNPPLRIHLPHEFGSFYGKNYHFGRLHHLSISIAAKKGMWYWCHSSRDYPIVGEYTNAICSELIYVYVPDYDGHLKLHLDCRNSALKLDNIIKTISDRRKGW